MVQYHITPNFGLIVQYHKNSNYQIDKDNLVYLLSTVNGFQIPDANTEMTTDHQCCNVTTDTTADTGHWSHCVKLYCPGLVLTVWVMGTDWVTLGT